MESELEMEMEALQAIYQDDLKGTATRAEQ
jgi:hypothetical protein